MDCGGKTAREPMIPRQLADMQERIEGVRDRLVQLRQRLEGVLQSVPKMEPEQAEAKPQHDVPMMQTLIKMDEQIGWLRTFADRIINDLEL